MPELPDVEQYRRIAARAAGETVRRVHVPDPDLLEGTTPQGLGRSLVGRVLDRPYRHGKWLIVRTQDDGPGLLYHFGMTGSLHWTEDQRAEQAQTNGALVLACDGGALQYRTQRRLGGVWYLRAGQHHEQVTGSLGPDATAVDREELARVLGGKRGGLKSALLDQQAIAGLGNELIDELLWRSRLHPRLSAAQLDEQQLDVLHQALHEVLERSIDVGHVPDDPDWLNAYRSDESPRCPRCDAPLRRATVAGRTTLWCPKEQAEGA